MAIVWPEEIGQELEAQLPSELAPRRHGSLTIALVQVLEGLDPTQTTIEQLLASLWNARLRIELLCDEPNGLLLSAPSSVRAGMLLGQLEEYRPCQLIATLEKMIARKEAQNDYWPEGRLNLGIAYAALGEHATAARWLEQAVDILTGRGPMEDSQAMAA